MLFLFRRPRSSVFEISPSAEEAHPLDSIEPLASMLNNNVFTVGVGRLFFKLQCLCTYNAAQQTYQRTLIVIQMCHRAPWHWLTSP
jgi:hypothetical protein